MDINLKDRPIDELGKDCFDVQRRIVDKIDGDLIQNDSLLPLTIAITGEWGVGKTSVINLLIEKLKKNRLKVLLY